MRTGPAAPACASLLCPKKISTFWKIGWPSNWPSWRRLRCLPTMQKIREADPNPIISAPAPTCPILIAEDSAMYRRVIGDHLKAWGFDFQCVKDGKDAWK